MYPVMLCENRIGQHFSAFSTYFKPRLNNQSAHSIIVFYWMIVTKSNLKSLKVMPQANSLYNLLNSSMDIKEHEV